MSEEHKYHVYYFCPLHDVCFDGFSTDDPEEQPPDRVFHVKFSDELIPNHSGTCFGIRAYVVKAGRLWREDDED